jgi:hypothetical protein
MANKEFKIVVFDLDETLGYFSELFIFILALEEQLHKKISSETFFKLLDLFPEFLRPRILSILQYLKSKKERNSKIKVMIYTNNQGPRSWVIQIKEYFENKLNYKLFDQIIAAFKVKGRQIEMCRTTHDKTVNDFLRCTQLPRDTKICFLDDQVHEEMESENVFYINVKPYYYNLSFKEMAERYYDKYEQELLRKLNKTKEQFVSGIINDMNITHFKPMEKDPNEQKIDDIVGKKILTHLNEFFKWAVNDKTRKHLKHNNKKTRKK